MGVYGFNGPLGGALCESSPKDLSNLFQKKLLRKYSIKEQISALDSVYATNVAFI